LGDDDTAYACYYKNNKLALVELHKGNNGKYRIYSVAQDSNKISVHETVHKKDSYYIVICGHNKQGNIARIDAWDETVDDRISFSPVPETYLFMARPTVKNSGEDGLSYIIWAYDNEGKEIDYED